MFYYSDVLKMAADQSYPTVVEFAEVLKQEGRWYQLGIFMGASMQELNAIHDLKNHANCDILLLLIKLYECLEKKGKSLLTWEAIATALRRIDNHSLAEKIYGKFCTRTATQEVVEDITVPPTEPPIQATVSLQQQGDISTIPMDTHSVITSSDIVTRSTTHSIVSTASTTDSQISEARGEATNNSSDNDAGAVVLIDCKVFNEYCSLAERFHELLLKVKHTFIKEQINLDVIQDILRRQRGVLPLPQDKVAPDAVFTRVEEHCSIINFHILVFLVKNLLSTKGKVLLKKLKSLKESVDRFKGSANMVELVTLIKSKQATPTEDQKIVKLKVREFWEKFTMKQFETIINEVFSTFYDIMTHITVTKGCICLTWIIPNTTELLPVLPLELVRLIGVIYLHIGSNVIYNIEGEGCESIEAAMIQAIELKNTRAIELLIAVGCNPEVAAYIGDNAVTNIVNIRANKSMESLSSDGSSHSVDHVCILGHNNHVEAIVDPASELEECSSCIVKGNMNKHLHQELDLLQQKLNSELESLKAEEKEKLKMKDAEITLLKKSFEALKEESIFKVEGVPVDLKSLTDGQPQSEVPSESNTDAEKLPGLTKALGSTPELLLSVSDGFLDASLIDLDTKKKVVQYGGSAGAQLLLDVLHLKLEQSGEYEDLALAILRKEKDLKDIIDTAKQPSMKKPHLQIVPKVTHSPSPKHSPGLSLRQISPRISDHSDISLRILHELFNSLLVDFTKLVSEADIYLDKIKMKLGILLQYSHHSIPELKKTVAGFEQCPSIDGAVKYLMERNLLNYLNFQILKLFQIKEFNKRIQEYETSYQLFMSNKFEMIAKTVQEMPGNRLENGLPEMTIDLNHPWETKSYSQWQEVLQGIVDWTEFMLIKNIQCSSNAVSITYSILPFMLMRIVKDIDDTNTFIQLNRVGASFTISPDIMDRGRSEAEVMKGKIKSQLTDNTSSTTSTDKATTQTGVATIPTGYKLVTPIRDDHRCQFCVGLLNEPYHMSCCGNLICYSHISNSTKKCPVCHATSFFFVRSVQIEKEIDALSVECTAKDCDWLGPLEGLKKHTCPETNVVNKKKKQINKEMAKYSSPQGIIYIIGITDTEGTNIDVENVRTTFEDLNFAVLVEMDPSAEDVRCLIEAAASIDYPTLSKFQYVAFYFTGHGGMNENGEKFIVCLQEKDEVLLINKHIIDLLSCLHKKKISRIFLFDCCQSKGHGVPLQSTRRGQPPNPGELIAYATNEGKKSWGDGKNGGIWTYHLCKNIREMQNEAFVTVVSKTYDNVVSEKADFQEPLLISAFGMKVLSGKEAAPGQLNKQKEGLSKTDQSVSTAPVILAQTHELQGQKTADSLQQRLRDHANSRTELIQKKILPAVSTSPVLFTRTRELQKQKLADSLQQKLRDRATRTELNQRNISPAATEVEYYKLISKYQDDLLKLIPSMPEYAKKLRAAKFVSQLRADNVISSDGAQKLDVDNLYNEVVQLIKYNKKQKEILAAFCGILEELESPALSAIALQILEEAGLSENVD